MPKFPTAENAPAIAAAREAIGNAGKNVADITALFLPAQAHHDRVEKAFPTARLRLRLAGDVEGLEALERERNEAKANLDGIKADIATAQRELDEAKAVLRRLEHAEQNKRASRQAVRFMDCLRELDKHLEAGADLWRKAWEEKEKLIVGWPGGMPATYNHPALAEGGLLHNNDLTSAIRAGMYRHGGVEFVSAQVNTKKAPMFPGAKPRHPLKGNPKDNKTLSEAADHAQAYLTALLMGKPWPPAEKKP
jgi:hypothetical protein